MEEIKQRLQLLRKALKLSQGQFGARLGIRQTSISQMETGDRAISERNLQLICEKFNVSEAWLREGKGEMFVPPNSREEQIHQWLHGIFEEGSHFQQSFIASFSRFTDKEWDMLEHLIMKMLAEQEQEKANAHPSLDEQEAAELEAVRAKYAAMREGSAEPWQDTPEQAAIRAERIRQLNEQLDKDFQKGEQATAQQSGELSDAG